MSTSNRHRILPYKPKPSYSVGAPVIGAYYKSNIPQIIATSENVRFNMKTLSRKIMLCHDDCSFTIEVPGNYKIDFILSIEPNVDLTGPPEAHIFGLTLNGNIINTGIFASYQPNNIGSYQLCGSITQAVNGNCNVIGLKNLSMVPITLTSSVNGIEIIGATINIIKIE